MRRSTVRRYARVRRSRSSAVGGRTVRGDMHETAMSDLTVPGDISNGVRLLCLLDNDNPAISCSSPSGSAGNDCTTVGYVSLQAVQNGVVHHRHHHQLQQQQQLQNGSLKQQQQQQLALPPRQTTLRDDEVAYVFREPYMLTGYRVPYENWTYYAASLFHTHNESFNVWTHLVAFFVFVYEICWWIANVPDAMNEPLTWPFLGFALGTLAYSTLSTVAHLFQSKSELVHYTFFQMDYIGIGLNCTGSSLLAFYFSGNESFYTMLGSRGCLWYELGNFILGFVCCVSCGFAKLLYLRPYTFQQMFLKMGVCGIHIFYGFMPLFCRYYEKLVAIGDSDAAVDRDVTFDVCYTITFFTAVFFYATSAPERLCPGRFDLLGYGHGLFHIAMAMTSLFQYSAAWHELQRRQHLLASPLLRHQLSQFPRPTCWLIVAEFVAMVTACAVFVVCTHRLRIRRVEEIRSFVPKVNAAPAPKKQE